MLWVELRGFVSVDGAEEIVSSWGGTEKTWAAEETWVGLGHTCCHYRWSGLFGCVALAFEVSVSMVIKLRNGQKYRPH